MQGTFRKRCEQQIRPRWRRSAYATLGVGGLLAMLADGAAAQQQPPMGSVATRDARVTGGLEVQGDQARLFTNASVTAYDRTAPIALARGGEVLVCSTSEFHLLRSGVAGALVFGLNRGAIEIRSAALLQDALLTPDLKLVPVTKGTLDLRLRVTREGDTCVENAGAQSPVLNVTDPFSAANYRVLPGQHLLFVKGDLHKVVDHERSSCGCPTAQQVAVTPGQPMTKAQAAAATHPFPQAQSEGLAPTAEASNAAPVGTASSQVSTTFSYGEDAASAPGVAPARSAPTIAATPATPGASANRQGGFFHTIGRFFHRVFHGS